MDIAATSSTLAERTTKRTSLVVAGLAAILGMMWVGTSAAPVFADEFSVGVVVEAGSAEPGEGTFMEGFQLAVDQSPDVSHPAGEEGGDHLGSMDVVMIVADDATGPGEILGATVEMIERDGVPIIVADVSPDSLAAIVGPAADAETMLIVMSDIAGLELPATASVFAAQEQVGVEALLVDREPAFEDAFVAANERMPSAAAARGYIAGRLVDIGVEATDRDPFDVATLAAALAAVADAADGGTPEASPDD